MVITRIESHRLSDDTLVEISKHGRTYTYMHTSNGWLEAPEITFDLNKAQAYAMLENDLRNDVTEAY